ncbi:MAG: hypothetical protein AB7E47_09905 [Desulfovibrionaceae bacterium]
MKDKNNKALKPPTREDLENRIMSLEEQARFTLDVLEMASELGDFQANINRLHEPTEILRETISRIGGIISFQCMAFMLVDENDSDFTLNLCEPDSFAPLVRSETGHLIDSGIFSLAIRENRPITVYSRDKEHRIVLHVLATNARTRGMFIGLMHRKDRNISSIVLSLLTIILKNCANAIESFELYRLLRDKLDHK